ncbi:hypothetical protein A1OE_353 [Candidatus Endolissoclinum faulkneri L2]|uniref:Uncharacterized protein n=1 Tax=Candidatus Endolissoclinum faulkneri L2 TaxID=1193729 RepID=K7Z3J1_9PROT|nr:hypothetical protein A1OE_353 [Candidatus Endolissoclinum faulkneri L2]
MFLRNCCSDEIFVKKLIFTTDEVKINFKNRLRHKIFYKFVH